MASNLPRRKTRRETHPVGCYWRLSSEGAPFQAQESHHPGPAESLFLNFLYFLVTSGALSEASLRAVSRKIYRVTIYEVSREGLLPCFAYSCERRQSCMSVLDVMWRVI